jgi:hypothetical protein
MVLIFGNPENNFWLTLVFLGVLLVGYFGFRLTKGFIGGYLNAEIGDKTKAALLIIHGLGSLVLALMLSNNYLVSIDFFHDLYAQSELWIAASSLVLLFMFLLLFGSLFTLMTNGRIRNIGRIKK